MNDIEHKAIETESRFEAVSRRAFLKRAAAFGAVALFPGLAACGSDADQFAAGAGTTTTAAFGELTTAATQLPSTTQPLGITTSATPTGAPTAPGTQMLITFSYVAAGDGLGRVRNPYVAVWVEDSDGELVDTISLWYLQTQKGARWLPDLRRWYAVDGGESTVDTISSATRTPGDYSLAWDATGLDGSSIEQGEYFVCIESAREHGPYSLIREPVVLNGEEFALELQDDGELTNATVAIVAG